MANYKLSSHKIATTPVNPDSGYRSARHLAVGDRVAITQEGWREHHSHNMWSKIAVGGTIGLVFLPALAGFGGVGLAMGGGGVGISALEIAAIGSGVGAAGGKAIHNPQAADGSKLGKVKLIDLVGVVRNIDSRWTGNGWDVQVAWMTKDSYGEWAVAFTLWHDPLELYGLAKA